jgi:hypothetical protein
MTGRLKSITQGLLKNNDNRQNDNNMAKKQKTWVYRPVKTSPKVSATVKTEVKAKADEFIETFIKPVFIKPPPENSQCSYIVDIYSKWYSHYFYFCSKYRCPAPECISEFFESKFVRLEYAGNNRFNFAYMRHTGQWFEVYPNITLDECLKAIKENPNFQP